MDRKIILDKISYIHIQEGLPYEIPSSSEEILFNSAGFCVLTAVSLLLHNGTVAMHD